MKSMKPDGIITRQTHIMVKTAGAGYTYNYPAILMFPCGRFTGYGTGRLKTPLIVPMASNRFTRLAWTCAYLIDTSDANTSVKALCVVHTFDVLRLVRRVAVPPAGVMI